MTINSHSQLLPPPISLLSVSMGLPKNSFFTITFESLKKMTVCKAKNQILTNVKGLISFFDYCAIELIINFLKDTL